MDSLTQIVLGAAVGEVTLGKKIGWKAQLIGAIAGTVPDLDVLLNKIYTDPIDQLEIHRSYSHALFTHVFLAIPFAYLCHILFKKKYTFKAFYLLWFLALSTHAILDSFTTYGTQLLLPFSNTLIGWDNISVVDPLYTLPFLALLLCCLFIQKENPKRLRLAWWSIAISSMYMLMTFGFKYIAHQHFEKALQAQHISYDELDTSPTIFNSLLWAGIAYNQDTIYMGEYSIFESKRKQQFVAYPRNLNTLKGFESKEVDVLKWFSQGKYLCTQNSNNTLHFFVVKWGRSDMFSETKTPEEAFLFYTTLIKTDSGIIAEQVEPKFENGFWPEIKRLLVLLHRRIWD